MRKEVKLGMALGGGLVALLIAYLIVAPPSDHKRGTQLVGADGTNIIDPTSQTGGDVATPAAPEAAAAEVIKAEHVLPQPPAEQSKVAKPEQKAGANHPAGHDNWTTPLTQGTPAGGSPIQAKAPVATGSAPAGTTTTALESGKPAGPTVIAPKAPEKRPTKVAENTQAKPETVPLYVANPNDAYGGGVNDINAAVERAVKGSPAAAPAPKAIVTADAAGGSEIGSTTATPAAGSTHLVRSGETFSSIAQTVYGSAAYYPHLIRANPHANPNNLKLGTTITIPKLEDVKAIGGNAGAERSGGAVFKVAADKALDEVKIDTAKQYRVQSGDSLYKISLKKFGTPNYVEAIYEKNRQQIGANPTRLKLGMILEMPEKTAVTSTDPRSALGDGTAGGEQH
jgi:LysM repeat protein